MPSDMMSLHPRLLLLVLLGVMAAFIACVMGGRGLEPLESFRTPDLQSGAVAAVPTTLGFVIAWASIA